MILALDTGLNNYGYAVLNHSGKVIDIGVVKSKGTKGKKVSSDYRDRIEKIAFELSTRIEAYKIEAIFLEMPTFGAQSSKAAISLTAGAAIAIVLSVVYRCPIHTATPSEVKAVLTGDPRAGKSEIIKAVASLYGWDIEYKKIKGKSQPNMTITSLRGEKFSAGKFEHIADAISAYYAVIKKRLNQ